MLLFNYYFTGTTCRGARPVPTRRSSERNESAAARAVRRGVGADDSRQPRLYVAHALREGRVRGEDQSSREQELGADLGRGARARRRRSRSTAGGYRFDARERRLADGDRAPSRPDSHA